ncbi:hypothetical protein [Paraburkholderia sp. J7]|uniref:hypothetical protein n=1 Tax=Paraburkholderia sp. J7 TaxID=2805438 RepID=UPI002AB7DED3|nr:hypothetical protein [Paraburkholderia sp. J7]
MTKILFIQYTALALACLYGANTNAACGGSENLPSEQVHIAFEVNGAKISPSERERLRVWVTQANSKYAIQNWITIIGSAAESEHAAKALAMSRAVLVAREALQDGLVNAPLQIKTEIYPVGKSEPASSDYREVTVQISPGCPNNCCDGQ